MTLQAHPTEGPVDPDLEATRFYKVTFPTDPRRLPIQYFDTSALPRFTSGLFYTNTNLYHQAVFPAITNKRLLMRVMCLPELEPGSRDDVIRESWPNHATFQYHLHMKALRADRRLLSVLFTTTNGQINSYRLHTGGASHRFIVDTPEAVLQLLKKNNIRIPGGVSLNWSGLIHSQDIVFEPNQVFSRWLPTHKAGILPVGIHIPYSILSRVFVRFRISNRHRNVSSMKIIIEGFIVPREEDERVKSEMRQDYVDMLNTSAAPAFTFWVSPNIKWDVIYPTIPSIFSTKWPVPGILETEQNCRIRPNEFQIRRVAHDILFKAGWGKPMDKLSHFFNWITDPARQYFFNRIPTLVLPYWSGETVIYNHITSKYHYPGQNPPAATNDTEEMAWTPFISQLYSRFESRRMVQSYSGGQYEETDWEKVEKMDTTETEVQMNSNAAMETEQGATSDEGKDPGLSLTLTAVGKHGTLRDITGLSSTLREENPEINKTEADILARVTHAGISANTAKNHKSMRKKIQELFPERADVFKNNKPGDQLLIVGRLLNKGCKTRTVLSYLASYDRMVLDAGGKHYQKPPALPKIIAGLKNLSHNPASLLANPGRTAYSLHSLQLVAIRAANLMRTAGKWNEYKTSLFRATMTLLFFGRLRSAEALMDKNNTADILTSLLLKDVVFGTDKDGNISHVMLWLRSAKYQESTGAMVVIPRLHGKRYCPVRCLIKYIKLRNQRIANKEVSDNLPLLLTEHLWRKGSSRADKNQVGFYTKSRFSKDVSAAIKLLAAHVPSVVGVMASLKSHSLRSGIPTALQKFKNLPESLKKSIGRWHSNASQVYQKNLAQGNYTSFFIQRALIIAAQQGPGEDDQYVLSEE